MQKVSKICNPELQLRKRESVSQENERQTLLDQTNAGRKTILVYIHTEMQSKNKDEKY